jgi:hypothetical protein
VIFLPKFPYRASWSIAWVIRTGVVDGDSRAGVGSSVGSLVGLSAGSSVGPSVGLSVGPSVGSSVGHFKGVSL